MGLSFTCACVTPPTTTLENNSVVFSLGFNSLFPKNSWMCMLQPPCECISLSPSHGRFPLRGLRPPFFFFLSTLSLISVQRFHGQASVSRIRRPGLLSLSNPCCLFSTAVRVPRLIPVRLPAADCIQTKIRSSLRALVLRFAAYPHTRVGGRRGTWAVLQAPPHLAEIYGLFSSMRHYSSPFGLILLFFFFFCLLLCFRRLFKSALVLIFNAHFWTLMDHS